MSDQEALLKLQPLKNALEEEPFESRRRRMLAGALYGLLGATAYALLSGTVDALTHPGLSIFVDWSSILLTWLWLGFGLAFFGALTGWFTETLEPHQQNRLLVFLNPSLDPRGASYNELQSRIAVGSGGWFGKGFTEGSQKRLAFLPEQHTDFIWSVVGEELGFLGVVAGLVLFLFLFLRVIRVATRANDSFGSLAAFGLAASWFVHVIVNVGMTINLMPITGIPLPFFSYGGSFLLATAIALGLVLRVAWESRRAGYAD